MSEFANLSPKEREEAYAKYLKTAERRSGEGKLSLTTISMYLDYLKKKEVISAISTEILPNFYQYKSYADVIEANRILRASPHFEKVNQTSAHGTLAATIEHYLNFLKEYKQK
ncbi:hypothetical protein [Entomospira culicis]|uniref:Uncharacterized protein n=1 Tax=Entomospira culicis TaxID=2719989 RepID=A0A968GJ91_9SPIO|nr:hypothetical protein [Entomospira culicis]NIZ18645.1 hypothetical protein [Entomospira culicis]NIZ68860.1 hypothetical protein [Entomospira culicis]WDI37454.1 hypothetical protein PVA46_01305 [Entomospira culicis]WDI39082.1 hypothetical protein PVA47_01310 [Entomospira culicis]